MEQYKKQIDISEELTSQFICNEKMNLVICNEKMNLVICNEKMNLVIGNEKIDLVISNEKKELIACHELDEIVQLSILYDFYSELLNSHKKQIFEDYVLNDLSLSEIAVNQGISRQGVYDIVRRCSIELKDYESKLNLVRKFQSVKGKLDNIKLILSVTEQTGDFTRITEIKGLADDILKEL